VAQVRARRLLMRSVADATVAQDLSRFVSPEIADQITTADRAIQPGDGEVKAASIMFCDIEGFTGISERMAPDELIRTLNEYFEVFSRIIDQHRGVITQFQGDAMLVSFNTARPDPDHAANAVRTAIGFQQIISRMRFGPGIVMRTRCGINTGKLISGAVGTRDRLLFTVFGDEVNIAARLEQLNKEYGTYILATEQTIAAAGGGFDSRRIGRVTVRGRTTPVEVFTIEVPEKGTVAAR